MKKIVQLVVVFIFFSVYSQQKADSIYKKFQKIKYDNNSYVSYDGILSNEYNIYTTKTDSSFVNIYKFVTFGVKANYSYYESPLKARFWIVPIKVFIDKKIDMNVRKNISYFIKKFPKIRNLQIELVNSKNQANYIIEINDSRLYTKIDDYNKFQNPEYFYGINFEMIKDENDKIYSGRLFFNPKQIIDKQIQIKKIKQFFMSSLGAFIISNLMKNESLLSDEYIDSEKISEMDIKMLQYHYNYYSLNEITNLDFNKIQQELKKITKQTENTTVKIKIP